MLLAPAPAALPGLSDLQHEAGHGPDGLEELGLARIALKHAVERLTELDELVLRDRERERERELHYTPAARDPPSGINISTVNRDAFT